MQVHCVEDHVKVYLRLEDGKWEIDVTSDDGFPLDGLEDGAQCIGVETGAGDLRACSRACQVARGAPALPTLPELAEMIRAYYGGKPAEGVA